MWSLVLPSYAASVPAETWWRMASSHRADTLATVTAPFGTACRSDRLSCALRIFSRDAGCVFALIHFRSLGCPGFTGSSIRTSHSLRFSFQLGSGLPFGALCLGLIL